MVKGFHRDVGAKLHLFRWLERWFQKPMPNDFYKTCKYPSLTNNDDYDDDDKYMTNQYAVIYFTSFYVDLLYIVW